MDSFKINTELIETILRYIVDVDESGWPDQGLVLIFVPGLAEIQSIHDRLCDSSILSKYFLVTIDDCVFVTNS